MGEVWEPIGLGFRLRDFHCAGSLLMPPRMMSRLLLRPVEPMDSRAHPDDFEGAVARWLHQLPSRDADDFQKKFGTRGALEDLLPPRRNGSFADVAGIQ